MLPEAPQLFSPEEVVEFSWMAALHLHLPCTRFVVCSFDSLKPVAAVDPIDAEVRLDVPAEAADVPSIDRSTAHQKVTPPLVLRLPLTSGLAVGTIPRSLDG